MSRTLAEMESALDFIRASPRQSGVLELIVRRPAVDEREVVHEAQFDHQRGLVGDSWERRPSRSTADGTPHPGMQINIMNTRVIQAITADRSQWPLAGDQLFVDVDLSPENVPAGTRLRVGTTTLEVTELPHTGCGKFARRFGVDAVKFVNSPRGRALNLRGVNARVVWPGIAVRGDMVVKEPAIRVRTASPADLRDVRDCLATAFEEYRSDYTSAMFDDTVPSLDGLQQRATEMAIWVACAADGRIVGTLAGAVSGPGIGHLRGMAVAPEQHGRGIALALLQTAEAALRARGCATITLDTTAPLNRAMAFYEKHGYRRSGAIHVTHGMELIEFQKTLSSGKKPAGSSPPRCGPF